MAPLSILLAGIGPGSGGGGGLTSGVVNARSDPYLAAGNNSADDYLAIQGALDDMNALGGGAVLLPQGTYITSQTLERHSNTLLVGAGWGTVIKSTVANPIIRSVASPMSGDADLTRGTGLENLVIDGGAIGNGLTGVYHTKWIAGGTVEAGRNNWLRGCLITNCGTGMRLVQDQGIEITSTRFHNNGTGLDARDNSQLGVCTQCDFRFNTVAGTRLEATNGVIGGTPDRIYGWQFDRCHWESNSGKGVVLDGATFNTFNTCKWENNDGTFVETIDTASGYRPDGNIFINPTMNGCAATPAVYQMDFVKGSMNQIIGGQFNTGSTNGIRIAAAVVQTLILWSNITASKFSDSSPSTTILSPALGIQRFVTQTGLDFGVKLGGSGDAMIVDTNEVVIAGGGFAVGDRKLLSGSGTPEGAVTAQIGSIYMRTNGGAGTSLYVKESGGGNTGWIAK